MPSKVWGKITYLFPNLTGVKKGINEYIPHFMMDVITYPGRDLS